MLPNIWQQARPLADLARDVRQREDITMRFGRGGRLAAAAVVALVAIISYCSSQTINPVTGERQYVALNEDQEIALGLQAAPEMAAQHGGMSPDPRSQQRIDTIGRRLVERSVARNSPYPFEFHVLADSQTVNAFALPGGQIFITEGLLRQLATDAQVAGVLGHEIGHVIGRHGAEHLATQRLTQGLAGAAVIASDSSNAQVAMIVGQLVNMKFGRDDELESDRIGIDIMSDAGYDPRALAQVMKVLAAAGGGRRQPEFFSTHPNPDNRIGQIEDAIRRKFPDGVPENLEE